MLSLQIINVSLPSACVGDLERSHIGTDAWSNTAWHLNVSNIDLPAGNMLGGNDYGEDLFANCLNQATSRLFVKLDHEIVLARFNTVDLKLAVFGEFDEVVLSRCQPRTEIGQPQPCWLQRS